MTKRTDRSLIDMRLVEKKIGRWSFTVRNELSEKLDYFSYKERTPKFMIVNVALDRFLRAPGAIKGLPRPSHKLCRRQAYFLDEPICKKLVKVSQKLGRSKSAIVNAALRQLFEMYEEEKSPLKKIPKVTSRWLFRYFEEGWEM